jgi:hypothetical protein
MGAEKPFGGLGERLLTVKDVAQFLQCSIRKCSG